MKPTLREQIRDAVEAAPMHGVTFEEGAADVVMTLLAGLTNEQIRDGLQHERADLAAMATLTPEELTATLWVGRSSSQCGHCRKGADPRAKRHEKLMTWGDNNGTPGCGARFVAVASQYHGAEEATQALRPDLPLVPYES